MAFWEWQATYSVNITDFDAHHQKLIALINELYVDVFELEDISQKQSLIGKALAEFIDYGLYHFEAEEELMRKYEYPDYVPHKEEHEQFKLEITKLMDKHNAGTLIWEMPILNFLKDWIIFHVINTDKQYEPYLKENNIK